MTPRSQILFTQGGKGGVGKTTVIAPLTAWIRSKGFDSVLLDFDNENREKCSFQSFYPEAQKLDIRAPDSLDRKLSLTMLTGNEIRSKERNNPHI